MTIKTALFALRLNTGPLKQLKFNLLLQGIRTIFDPKKGVRASIIAIALHALATPVNAAELTNASNDLQQRSIDQDMRAREQRQQQQNQLNPPTDVRLTSPQPVTAALLPQAEQPCFEIREISLKTTPVKNNWNWLLAHANGHSTLERPDPVIGRCLGAQGIQIVIDRMQNALMAQGYVTSRILASPQSLQSGHLELQLIQGRINSVRWAEGSGKRGSRWNTLPLEPGDILNLRDIEQALENYKRVPTAEASVDIQPAEEPGYSDLVISHQQARLFRFSAGLDDSGTSSTGKYQGNATVSYDNWWTLSDLFYMTLQRDLGGSDPGPRGTLGHTIHYSVPFNYNLLSFTLSHNHYHQTVAGANADILYSGTSDNFEGKLSRVIHRDNAGKTTVSLKGFQRRSNNYIDDTEVEVQRRVVSGLEWGLGHRRSWYGGSLDANVNYRRGTGAWGSLPSPEDAFGEGTSRMRLWLLDAAVQWPFELAHRNLTLGSTWRGQYNQTPLTPQDRLSIGGRYSVRGFDGLSVLSAERGWVWRNDIALEITPGVQLYAGLDRGFVTGPAAKTLVGQSLTGLVFGFRGQYNKLQFDAFAGQPLQQPAQFHTASNTTGFSMSFNY